MTAATPSSLTGPIGAVVCPAVLDHAYAPDLRDALLRAMADGGDVEVLADAVTQADTANLQVLCAAALDLGRSGRTLRLVTPSAPLIRVIERLGLAAVLGVTPAARTGAPLEAPFSTNIGK
jgi:anti-anti-sigma regulatory factor